MQIFLKSSNPWQKMFKEKYSEAVARSPAKDIEKNVKGLMQQGFQKWIL
jgi:BMFP domain-containing protein YqiC